MRAEDLREHYGTAPGCLYATYDEVAAAIYVDFSIALASEPRWSDALRAGALALLARLRARPAEARLCFAEIFQGDYELLRRREASRRRLVNLFVRELGRRRDHPEAVAVQLELLIGSGFQAIAGALRDRGLDELDGLARELEARAYVFEPVVS